jgi:peptidoglycan/xylan/chitin deacetylase (PgdA/CDA1 family)
LDDGYQDNFLNLRAVAEATGVPVTVFVCTGKVADRQEFRHDMQWGLNGFVAMTWEEVTRLDRCGISIGSHTRSHFDCAASDPEKLRDEIVGSKADLVDHLGHDIAFFSFPWGKPENMSPEAVVVAKATYPVVCSAYGGANFAGRGGVWHLLRCPHPNSLWELELTLQGILDRPVGGIPRERAITPGSAQAHCRPEASRAADA